MPCVIWALQISLTLRGNAWRKRSVTIPVALQDCIERADSFWIWQPDELLIINPLPYLQTLSPSAHTTAMGMVSAWLDPATAFQDSSGRTAPEVIITPLWCCYSDSCKDSWRLMSRLWHLTSVCLLFSEKIGIRFRIYGFFVCLF